MDGYFELLGTLIKIAAIKSFRIEQREYIYRPVYREKEKTLLNRFSSHKYEFYQMQPYAAIINENERKSAVGGIHTKNLAEAMGKDIFEGVVTTIGDKFNLKAFRSKKYWCQNQTGRIFQTYIEDIPALLVRNDGKFSDVHKNDELYPQLGEPIAPAINIVYALVIKADEDYIFYGNGIQVDNIQEAYERLKYDISEYQQSLEKQIGIETRQKTTFPKLPKVTVPKLSAPKLELPKIDFSKKKDPSALSDIDRNPGND